MEAVIANEYVFEKNKLYSYLGEEFVKLFKKYELIIAGGTITSLFTNKDINDIDIYARSQDAAIGFMEDVWSVHVVSNTKKAIQFLDEDLLLQLIHFDFFDKPEDIFETFDYTVCMGAFDFKTEQFVLHKDFLKHNSQRLLKFNSNTAFPIVSMLRVKKYEDKGYKISKPEFIRVILTCMDLKINTYEELKEHLGGMYGQAYEKLFDDVKDEEFSLVEAVNRIADLALSEDYFKTPVSLPFDELEDIVDSITKVEHKFTTIKDVNYRIGYNNRLRKYHKKLPEKANIVNADELIKEMKIYKFIKKEGHVYSSFYKNSFKYETGKEIAAEGKLSRWDDSGKLFFNFKDEIKTSTYYDKKDKVLIEATIKIDDVIDIENCIKVRKAFITREVPETEWKEWIK